MNSPVRVVISYARKDAQLKNLLIEHLSGLQREGLATIWHVQEIDAGNRWMDQIDNHFELADVMLLLISPSFLASNYCYSVEMERALAREAAGLARTIPILLRPVDTQDGDLSRLQALPRNGVPVTQWANQDEAFQSIAAGLRGVVERLREGGPKERSVNEPRAYFKARMEVKWGHTYRGSGEAREKPFVYFAGTTPQTSFLLSASTRYLVGGHKPCIAAFSSSSLPHVIDCILGEIGASDRGDDPSGLEGGGRLGTGTGVGAIPGHGACASPCRKGSQAPIGPATTSRICRQAAVVRTDARVRGQDEPARHAAVRRNRVLRPSKISDSSSFFLAFQPSGEDNDAGRISLGRGVSAVHLID
jgi:hypothetical protein